MRPTRTQPLASTAAALLLACCPVLARAAVPAFPPYPATRTQAAISDWTARYTDVPPGQLVAVGTDSLFALAPAPNPALAPPSAVRVVVRQEAISPDFARRLGGRSAALTADIDCQGRRVFQRGVELYVGSNRQGSARSLGAASDWQAIPAGTYMEKVMAAACDPAWRSPFLAPPRTVAQAPAATPYAPPPASPPYAIQPPPAPTPALARGGGARAELGRFASVDAALAAWRDLAAAVPEAAGRPVRIEITNGAYRALLDGFAGRAEADAFCTAAQRAGKACRAVE